MVSQPQSQPVWTSYSVHHRRQTHSFVISGIVDMWLLGLGTWRGRWQVHGQWCWKARKCSIWILALWGIRDGEYITVVIVFRGYTPPSCITMVLRIAPRAWLNNLTDNGLTWCGQYAPFHVGSYMKTTKIIYWILFLCCPCVISGKSCDCHNQNNIPCI